MSRLVRRDPIAGSKQQEIYDVDCRRCDRLATFLDDVQREYPSYFCRPVPPFGDFAARLLIVGLAPGMHGANASGRPFTGDYRRQLPALTRRCTSSALRRVAQSVRAAG